MDYCDEDDAGNEDLRRLGEITEIVNDSDDEDNYSGDESDEDDVQETRGADATANQHLADGLEDPIASTEGWCWDLPLSERRLKAAAFLRAMSALLCRISAASDSYISAARRDRAEAGAYAFKNSRLVGATVVGASRRLEAIRAAGLTVFDYILTLSPILYLRLLQF